MIAWQCLLVLSVWDAAAKGLSSPVLRTGEGHSGVGDDRPPVTGSFIYNPKTKAWREGPALRTPRVETAAFTANGRIYQFGGSTKSLGCEGFETAEGRRWLRWQCSSKRRGVCHLMGNGSERAPRGREEGVRGGGRDSGRKEKK